MALFVWGWDMGQTYMNLILSSFAFVNCNFITLSVIKFLSDNLCLYIDFLEKPCMIIKLGLNQEESLSNTFNFYFKLGSLCSNPTRKSCIKIFYFAQTMAFLAEWLDTITWTIWNMGHLKKCFHLFTSVTEWQILSTPPHHSWAPQQQAT